MTCLRTNEDRLVKIAVQGKVANAYQWAEFEVAHDGKPFALPRKKGDRQKETAFLLFTCPLFLLRWA